MYTKLPDVSIVANATGMRVAPPATRHRAGKSGQAPSRGSPCAGRLHGRPVQDLLP